MIFGHENKYNHIKLHIIIALSAVAAMASLAAFFFSGSNSSEREIMNALEKMEIMKMGGIENRETVKKMYNSPEFKEQQTQGLQQALQRLGNTEQKPSTVEQEQQEEKNLSPEKIESIKSNAFIEGSTDAKFLIVEYTDPECPFCIRQFKDNTVENVIGDRTDIAHIVKVVQGVNHTNTENKSRAIICAGESNGNQGYYGMFDKIMGGTQGNTLTRPEENIVFAEELGIEKDIFETCITDNKSLDIYNSYWQEAISLGATGTPGNIIINTENGKYVHLAGAYPAKDFVQAIQSIE